MRIESLENVPSEMLIEELCSRDLMQELEPEKREWLKQNGFKQITHLQFQNPGRKVSYSLNHLKDRSVEQLDRKLKSIAAVL